MTRPACILLIDDNPMDVELALDAFREARLANRIEVAHDGETGLDYLLGAGRYTDRVRFPMPDLILLDLKMPRMDGFEVLRRIKALPILKRIPVIVLTSSREEGDLALSYDCGANTYLVKPVSFGGFVEVVRQIGEYWWILNVGPPLDGGL